VKLVHKFITAHDFSMKAATAALASDEQGKFWEFHDKLFENQSVLNDPKILEIAGALKLDLKRFKEKMKDPALEALINRDFAEARKLGIPATPWIYINGRHPLERALPDLVDAVNREIMK